MTNSKTFSGRKQLPLLVYRDLNRLCARYLQWVSPLLDDASVLETTRSNVESFRSHGGEGDRLQRNLEDILSMNSDLLGEVPFRSEWYLADRSALPVNSNPFYLLELPARSQAAQAASLTIAACDLFGLIEREDLEPDTFNDKPLCMEQYTYMFGAARNPRKGKDHFVHSDPSLTSPDHRHHIVVLRKGRIFRVDVIDEKGHIIERGRLEALFQNIISATAPSTEPVGALTALKRDMWAMERERLISDHPENHRLLKIIETSLFSLSLDNTSPADREKAARELIIGNTSNRWFDKTIQFIVFPNEIAGLNFEHSHLDGSPMAKLVQFITQHNGTTVLPDSNMDALPLHLDFHISIETRNAIGSAERESAATSLNTFIRSMEFEPFGKDEIKKRNFSPDAFIQIAIQLAQYRTWGLCRSVFESVMLRSFRHGRTEAMRPVSIESDYFVRSMADQTVPNSRRREILLKSGNEHVRRIGQCLAGEGVEGHLFALYHLWEISRGIDDTPPPIFQGEAWKRITCNFVSTSTTSVDGLELGGYGPTTPDGFSLRYLKKAGFLRFFLCSGTSITSDMDRFSCNLHGTLTDMLHVLDH